ncbi:hypothetical protein C7444_107110 [Sphaerotilus hippei]|uniref:Polyketide cyclase/dehydrase/lipid transport protein n=1 Tax=Sphaerotilus hippei TaxID=744406 RepID=A0A318H0E2_9BURK|nr:SRPBCC family protein [Sphaerotilus hippei]PXW96204.1 hypothetical protein C7444_107110 [Sphaerotilus hippei]
MQREYAPMKSITRSVTIAAPAALVYAFASNPAHLPLWAPQFCPSVEYLDGQWVIESPEGLIDIRFARFNDLGILDHTVTLPCGTQLTNTMRVVGNGAGSEVLFTLFQHEDTPDEAFEDDADLAEDGLDHLRQTVERLLGVDA